MPRGSHCALPGLVLFLGRGCGVPRFPAASVHQGVLKGQKQVLLENAKFHLEAPHLLYCTLIQNIKNLESFVSLLIFCIIY